MRWRGHARDFSAPLKGACGREWGSAWERLRGLNRSLGRWSGMSGEASFRGFGNGFPVDLQPRLKGQFLSPALSRWRLSSHFSKPPIERVNTITNEDTLDEHQR
jgi:hypothetical protein